MSNLSQITQTVMEMVDRLYFHDVTLEKRDGTRYEIRGLLQTISLEDRIYGGGIFETYDARFFGFPEYSTASGTVSVEPGDKIILDNSIYLVDRVIQFRTSDAVFIEAYCRGVEVS